MKKTIAMFLSVLLLFSGCSSPQTNGESTTAAAGQGTESQGAETTAAAGTTAGEKTAGSVKLDPKNPVTITVWHYYNGSQKSAFDEMVSEFNQTKGAEEGIFVESYNQGNVTQLEDSVKASISKEVGSSEVPNIFASYADTAYEVEKMGYLVDLGQYMTEAEIAEYVDSYIEEGRIGTGGELKIFPTAKSSEIFMLNKTEWDTFSAETGASMDDLKTKEGLVKVAEQYYNWTDAKTPEPGDGKAFYGRDAMANLFIVGSMQLGHEIFHVENQTVTLDVDRDVMKKIWDFYYVPYVKGYFSAYAKFRSDDVKIGEIIALTGSTTSATYFPDTVEMEDGSSHPIEAVSLPTPVFEGGANYEVQQGAGMVVTKSTPEQEYASVVFLKWFTEADRNLEFSSGSGYLPVKKGVATKENLDRILEEKKIEIEPKAYDALLISYDRSSEAALYTNKAFDGGVKARKVLEYNLSDKAAADREAVLADLAAGKSVEEALAPYLTEENFETWFVQFQQTLEDAIK